MNTEQILLNKWRKLPHIQQQEVIDFLEFLEEKNQCQSPSPSNLGKKLRKIRQEIIESGVPLLSAEEVEEEKLERRGGYQRN